MKLRPRLALTVLAAAVPLTGAIAWIRSDLEVRTRARVLGDMVLSSMENGGREACEAWPETFPRGFDPLARWAPGSKDTQSKPYLRPEPRTGPRSESGRKEKDWGRPPRSGFGGDPGRGPGGPGGGPGGPGHRGTGPGPPHARIEIFAYDSTFVSANRSAPQFPEALQKNLEGGAESASSSYEAGASTGLQVAVRMPWKEGPCALVLARNPAQIPPAMDVDLLGASLVLTAGFLGVVLLAAGPLVRRVLRLTTEVRRSAEDRYSTPVDITGHDEVSQLATAFNEAGKELRSHLSALEKREETLRSFRTDEARRRCPEGLGLGLHIAKCVANRHGFEFRICCPGAGGLEVEMRGKSTVDSRQSTAALLPSKRISDASNIPPPAST